MENHKKQEMYMKQHGNTLALYLCDTGDLIGSIRYELSTEGDLHADFHGSVRFLEGKTASEIRNHPGDFYEALYMMPSEDFQNAVLKMIQENFGNYYFSPEEMRKSCSYVGKVYRKFEAVMMNS